MIKNKIIKTAIFILTSSLVIFSMSFNIAFAQGDDAYDHSGSSSGSSNSSSPSTPTPPSDSKNTNFAEGGFSVTKYLSTDKETNKRKIVEGGVGRLILNVINQLLLLIGSFALLTLVVAGFTYLISAGQERLITKAKDIIRLSIIGLIVTFSAYYIVAFVQSIFYAIK